mgnify:CR=1 FL=1
MEHIHDEELIDRLRDVQPAPSQLDRGALSSLISEESRRRVPDQRQLAMEFLQGRRLLHLRPLRSRQFLPQKLKPQQLEAFKGRKLDLIIIVY